EKPRAAVPQSPNNTAKQLAPRQESDGYFAYLASSVRGDLSLDIGLAPTSMGAEAFGLRERISLGELDAYRRQHRAPLANVGTGDGGFIARLEDWAVGPIARKYFLDTRWHGALPLETRGASVGEAGDLE
ncbi:MAG TPA: hypothetical protein VE288_09440, partial [Rubrobacteraceae bacterium]|nr:hypothetical protein [Rubrobacteraceae bacterium]